SCGEVAAGPGSAVRLNPRLAIGKIARPARPGPGCGRIAAQPSCQIALGAPRCWRSSIGPTRIAPMRQRQSSALMLEPLLPVAPRACAPDCEACAAGAGLRPD